MDFTELYRVVMNLAGIQKLGVTKISIKFQNWCPTWSEAQWNSIRVPTGVLLNSFCFGCIHGKRDFQGSKNGSNREILEPRPVKKKTSKTFVASSQPGFSPLKNEIGILFVVVAVHVLFFLLLHFLFRSSRVQRIGGRSTHRDIIWTAASVSTFWILISFCFYFFLGARGSPVRCRRTSPCASHTQEKSLKKNKIQREENQWPTTGRHECEQRKRTKAKRRGGRWPMAGLNSPPLFLDSVSVSSS